jgi:hypothetical protein
MGRTACLLAALALAASERPAGADASCGAVEVRFRPAAPNLQIAVWVEDSAGEVVDTLYITRLTGMFGLGNRPGAALLKTDCGWPYGRREMVLPVWAHRRAASRNKYYPRIVMGGVCGYSPQTMCPDGSACSGDCDDSTIAYHSRVSSRDPYYCAPGQGGSVCPDAISCASRPTLSKGAYQPGAVSVYPPRADIPMLDPFGRDSNDVLDFKKQNDLVAVSQATPPAADDVVVSWYPANLPLGDYVAWIETSLESDFSPGHDATNPDHRAQPDGISDWDRVGHEYLGQPSIVYRVPFRYDGAGGAFSTRSYAGYGAWDGSDGTLRAPDTTVVDTPGSGAGRLLDVKSVSGGPYRLQVVVGACAGSDGGMPDGMLIDCLAPAPVSELALTSSASGIHLSFRAPDSGVLVDHYEVRYQQALAPMTDSQFDDDIAATAPAVGAPGATLASDITSLVGDTSYTVGVRTVSGCGTASPVVAGVVRTTAPAFTVLHGCFVATAAWGSPMAPSVDALRDFRDRALLGNPGGRLLVATYYAFAPPLAGAIAADPRLRALARALLAPLVEGVTHR